MTLKPLPLFTESSSCRFRRDKLDGATCNGCRSSEFFRRSLLVFYSLPDNNVNFDCPHDVPWIGSKPETFKGVSRTKSFALHIPGPGDAMAGLINALYLKDGIPRGSCGCAEIRREMNEKGWLWCFAHRSELLERIKESALELGVTINGDLFWQELKSSRKTAQDGNS